jgi:AraC-like DNA-binding protein
MQLLHMRRFTPVVHKGGMPGYRLKRVLEYIADSFGGELQPLAIIEAELAAGFQDSSHFAHMFRKIEGTTPSKFRADYLPRAARIAGR